MVEDLFSGLLEGLFEGLFEVLGEFFVDAPGRIADWQHYDRGEWEESRAVERYKFLPKDLDD